MIYYSKIVKIKMDYITKYQYVKLIHFLRRHQKYELIKFICIFSLTRKLNKIILRFNYEKKHLRKDSH